MSLMLDRLYINYVSSRLERFKWVKDNVAVCRCPFCGDGNRGNRTRFYIYENVKYGSTAFNVECKNCGISMSFRNFLKDFDPVLSGQHRLESFRDKFGREPRDFFKETEKSDEEVQQDNVDDLVRTMPGMATPLSELPSDHSCVKYVLGRKIDPKFLSYFMYVSDFREFTAKYKNDSEYAQRMPQDARLIIPFYDEFGRLNCVQGRSLDPDNKMRYITIKNGDSAPKIFGLDRIDRSKTVRVCEGPIDSLFIKNCLATADADLLKADGDVYIPDNQYRNKDVCRHIDNMISAGIKVVLFPKTFGWKDINDAIKDGVTTDEIEAIIENNTFQGMKAKLVFAKLRGSNGF